MALASMRCPKCGLTQMSSPFCKACGTGANGQPSAKPLGSIRTEPKPETPSQFFPPKTEDMPAEVNQEPVPQAEFALPGEQIHMTNADAVDIRQPSFHGSGGTLFGIHMVNIFLTLITFSFYRFWGKVKIRSYLWGQTEFEGDRFAYHGTGKELLLGFSRGTLAFGLIYGLFNVAPFLPGGALIQGTALLLGYSLLMLFIPFAMVSTRRYRLSRSSWRGILFSFRGPVKDFIKLFGKGALLSSLTMGLYYPFHATNIHAFITSYSYLGNTKFEFDGRGKDLFGTYLVMFLLFVPTLGLYSFWFRAKKKRYLWEHTTFSTARFRSTVTGERLLLLTLGNILLLIVSFGLAWPWVTTRNLRFTFRHLHLEGPLDLASIQQEAQSATATGEALDGLLDLDTDFSVG